MVFFDASSVEGHYQELAREEFRSPANIPPMTWKTDSVPPVPANFSVEIANETITMYWENPDTTATGIHDIRQYNVYASPTYPIKIERGVNLKAVLPTGTTEWTFPKNIKVKPNWFFGVTSLNRVGVESELSTVMWGDTPHRSEQNTTVTDSH